MARPRRDNDDPRTHYTHQALYRTTGGIAKEQGASGKDTLLYGTLRAAFQFEVTIENDTPIIVGDMPMGVWIDGVILHASPGVGTYDLVLKGVGGAADHDIVLAGDLETVGEVETVSLVEFFPIYQPTDFTRPLEITFTGAPAGEMIRMSVLATSAESGWK